MSEPTKPCPFCGRPPGAGTPHNTEESGRSAAALESIASSLARLCEILERDLRTGPEADEGRCAHGLPAGVFCPRCEA